MNQKTQKLVECGVLIALSVALSFIVLWRMPLGGSVTLGSMLPVMLISYRHGVKWGLICSFTYSIVNMLVGIIVYGDLFSWGLSAQAIVASMCLDYILAFSVLGLCGILGTKFWQYMIGMTLAVLLRYICHVVSGVFVFGYSMPKGFANPLIYSLVYNSFLVPELFICLGAGAMLYKPLKKYFVVKSKADGLSKKEVIKAIS